MASIWDSITIKKGSGGVSGVTAEGKNSTVENAVSTWLAMGLMLGFGIVVILASSLCYAGGFALKPHDSYFVPQTDGQPDIVLPGTNIRVGLYRYIYDASEADQAWRVGFVIGHSRLLYLQDNRGGMMNKGDDLRSFDVGGEAHFGVLENYLLVDTYAYGSAYRRFIFLFKWSRDQVTYLDALDAARPESGAYSMEFSTEPDVSGKQALPEEAIFPGEFGFRWMDIRDRNNDGRAEIELSIEGGNKFEPMQYKLYLEIVDDKLELSLSPSLYERLFVREIETEKRSIQKPDRYYIYGFLSHRISLRDIKAALAGNQDQFEKIIPLLDHVNEWNREIHNLGKGKPALLQLNLLRR